MNKKQEQIRNAYMRVFGKEGQQTSDQEFVWKDLKKRFHLDQPAFIPDEAYAYCPLRAAITDGERRVVLFIDQLINNTDR